ncbi:hypothetical protein QCA50_007715 [Cerrena zonata]|uniref:NmrA-like domain-containing protein n=1 Tax=Cerrena zonata TaxID=2478898 RepID=A0AAW0GBK5_9APHY
MGHPTIFLLGATGYIGSDFLVQLGRTLPHLPVYALVRTPSSERRAWLSATHPNLTVVEGTLDSVEVIERQTENADIVINIASCDHVPSSQAILSGMTKRSAKKPGDPPLLLHISGCGCLSDNAQGNAAKDLKIYSDLDLDLELLPKGNPHLEVDLPIFRANGRKENPIRTAIIIPAVVYGVGTGIQKTPTWARMFLQFTKANGHSGTFGPGLNSMSNIHVKDVTSAILAVLKVALEGKADEGLGLYFVACNETRPSWHDIASAMGDYLYQKGVLPEPGSHPFSREFLDSMRTTDLSHDGHSEGWSELGSNQYAKSDRLDKIGWKPVETMRNNFLDALKESLDVALQA